MTIDLAIVGAGPAGMAAAVLASEIGLDTVLIDEQEGPGGQIYRGIESASPTSPLGSDYLAGQPLAAALRASSAQYRPATTVWHIDPSAGYECVLSLVADGRSEPLAARRRRHPRRLAAHSGRPRPNYRTWPWSAPCRASSCSS